MCYFDKFMYFNIIAVVTIFITFPNYSTVLSLSITLGIRSPKAYLLLVLLNTINLIPLIPSFPGKHHLFFTSFIFFFFRLYICDSMQCLSFSDLSYLAQCAQGPSMLLPNGRMASFVIAVQQSVVYIPHLYIHSSLAGHLFTYSDYCE